MQLFIAIFLCLILCVSGQAELVSLTIVNNYSYFAENERYTVHFGDSEDAPIFLSVNGTSDMNYTNTTHHILVFSGYLTFVLYDLNCVGWGAENEPSWIYVKYNDYLLEQMTIPFKSLYINETTSLPPICKEIRTFYFEYFMSPSNFFYYTDIPQPVPIWSSPLYDGSSWDLSTSTSLGLISSITRYYRFELLLISQRSTLSFTLAVKTASSFILYLNGNEYIRYRFPNGSFDATTLASGPNMKPHFVEVTFPHAYIGYDNVLTVGIEVHQDKIYTSLQDPFEVYLISRFKENNYCQDTVSQIDSATCSLPCTNTHIHCSDIFYDPFFDESRFINDTDSQDMETVSSRYKKSKSLVQDRSYHVNSHSLSIIFSYAYTQFKWINRYIVISSIFNKGDPQDWTLHSSMDGIEWTLLDIQKNVQFTSRLQGKTFYLRSNLQAYKYLRFVANSTLPESLSIYHISLYACQQTSLTQDLIYSDTFAFGYVFITSIYVYPLSSGFTNYSVLTPLPNGLYLDTDTGVISGIPVVNVIAQQVTVVAVYSLSQEQSSFNISMTFINCSPPDYYPLYIQKYYYTDASEESFVIRNEDQILYSSVIQYESIILNGRICVPPGLLTIQLMDSGNNGWNTGSILTLQTSINNHILTLSNFFLQEGQFAAYNISLDYILNTFSSRVRCLEGNIPSNWYTYDYNPDYWPVFDPSSEHYTNSTIWLFHTRFIYVNFKNVEYTSYELVIQYTGGICIFMNGKELYRQNLSPGPITNNTVATSGSLVFNYHTFTFPLTLLQTGINVFSVAMFPLVLHANMKIHYDAFIRMLHINIKIPRYFISTYDINPSFTGISKAFDYSINSEFSAVFSHQQNITVSIDFGSMNAEYINKYCIVSSLLEPKGDPSSWYIYGYDNKQELTLLTYEYDIEFSGTQAKRCFFIPLNTIPYRYYSFVFTKTASIESPRYYMSLNELELLTIDLESIVLPPFSITPDSIIGYKGMAFPKIMSSSDYFVSYTITPDLPSPLVLDSITGCIYGTPTSIFPTTRFMIYAKTPSNGNVSTSIAISIQECFTPNILFTIRITGGSEGINQVFTLLNSDKAVVYHQSGVASNTENYYPMCLPLDTYILVLSSTIFTQNGWNGGSFDVYLEDNIPIASGSLGWNVNERSIVLPLYYIIHPFSSTWKGYFNMIPVSPLWTLPEYEPATWIDVTTSDLPTPVTITTYYRYQYIINIDKSKYSSLRLSIRTKQGFIAFLNGNELFRRNLADVDVTASTICNQVQTNPINYIYDIPMSKLLMDTITIAIELHRCVVFRDMLTFFPSALWIPTNTSHVIDGQASCDIETTSTDFLFDGNIDTLSRSGPRCVDSLYTWTYANNNQLYINGYDITTGPNCNTNHPSGWVIEGSNTNGQTWTLLDVQQKILFTEYSAVKHFSFFSDQSYNAYRFRVIECNNVGINDELEKDSYCLLYNNNMHGFQLADLSYSSQYISDYCVPQDGFTGSLNGQVAYKLCDTYYTGYSQRLCVNGVLDSHISNTCNLLTPTAILYNPSVIILYKYQPITVTPVIHGAEYTCSIHPNLPNSLSFDTSNGSISGRSETAFDLIIYVVKCSNRAGYISTKISLVSLEAEQTSLWLVCIVIICSILFIIAVMMIIINRCKPKRTSLRYRNDILSQINNPHSLLSNSKHNSSNSGHKESSNHDQKNTLNYKSLDTSSSSHGSSRKNSLKLSRHNSSYNAPMRKSKI